MGQEMGKTFIDKNGLYLPSASPLLLETALLLCYYGCYQRGHHNGMAEFYSMAIADWSGVST